ncbi:nucleotide exchange factor GrpE [Elizabethkingia miricola]|uniref:nucleotide exchange factor GrpE n=1 Tax=Elizabethkingia miricola TaxID=172045 RepID=UPI00099A2DA7|nr:nucleotide exchange factor GrpE [Elizabethkingia miricola]OPC11702.1 nucleotide exchange factor GrpE [Elizabethkingia miricola]OPC34339.1 nucleotide exchange factor GrpE [Elizabethkingia miricola]
MDENKEIQAEETTPNENIENNDTTPTENLSATPSAEDQLAEEKDRYIRLYAEFENYKKRTTKEKMDFFKYANQDLMVSMLAVLDDFERAIKEISKNGNPEDLKGIELIYQKFKGKLTEKGLVTIEVQAGDSFDVDKHEAITQIPAPSDDLKGKIVDVIETGYMLHDKVIRFAKVVVGA